MAVLAKVLFEFTHFFEILGGEGGGGGFKRKFVVFS